MANRPDRPRRSRRALFRSMIYLAILVLLMSGIGIFWSQGKQHSPRSDYQRYSQQAFNQPTYYPANQSMPSNLYHAIGAWTGRLILSDDGLNQAVDRVEFEVHHAPYPYKDLIGKIVDLTWAEDSTTRIYVATVFQAIHFTEATRQSEAKGIVHPRRLNGKQVGPLQSLAGARPVDDVTVMLKEPVEVRTTAQTLRPTLLIAQEPVQITGRYYALVSVVGQDETQPDRVRVRHFNSPSRQFDGAEEVVLMPQVPADGTGVPRSTVQAIEQSPFNSSGWYVYGANNAAGMFVVQAIAPRALLQLQPDEIVLGKEGLAYINQHNWKQTSAQKGKGRSVLLDPVATTPAMASNHWQEGDRAIVLHLFGGIGGTKAEPTQFGVVTGHFAYGTARVAREPLTGDLWFEIEYQQVYAHNSSGIIAGTLQWAEYMGNLQRGWLGTRPVSDIVVKLDAVTQEYDFGGVVLSPLAEFVNQLQIMAARYRTGDGTGASTVTPATSCVQDSNQALYVAIKQFEQQVNSAPTIQQWLQQHPDSEQTRRFQELVQLGRSLENQLVPLGIVRRDWQQNAQTLKGARPDPGWFSTTRAALTSWRSLLPRRAHDEVSAILLHHKAQLWFIRTNQIGGYNPNILPLAPTVLLDNKVS